MSFLSLRMKDTRVIHMAVILKWSYNADSYNTFPYAPLGYPCPPAPDSLRLVDAHEIIIPKITAPITSINFVIFLLTAPYPEGFHSRLQFLVVHVEQK